MVSHDNGGGGDAWSWLGCLNEPQSEKKLDKLDTMTKNDIKDATVTTDATSVHARA